MIEIFSAGKKIHGVIRQCSENCCCSRYLSELEILLENMNGEETTHKEKMICCMIKSIKNLVMKYISYMIILLEQQFFFEIEKIKEYLKAFNDIEKLEGYLYVLSKKFYMILIGILSVFFSLGFK